MSIVDVASFSEFFPQNVCAFSSGDLFIFLLLVPPSLIVLPTAAWSVVSPYRLASPVVLVPLPIHPPIYCPGVTPLPLIMFPLGCTSLCVLALLLFLPHLPLFLPRYSAIL